MTVTGVLSSWEASVTKRCCRWAACTRGSMARAEKSRTNR